MDTCRAVSASFYVAGNSKATRQHQNYLCLISSDVVHCISNGI